MSKLSLTEKCVYGFKKAAGISSIGLLTACGANPEFTINPGASAALASAPGNGASCLEGGQFIALGGIFAGSSSRYNEDCGFLSTVMTIWQDPRATSDEKAFAIRALANKYPSVDEQLNEFADAVLSGRDPLNSALPAGTAVQCQVGERVSSDRSSSTFILGNCQGSTGPV